MIETGQALSAFGALSDPTRLAVLRHLLVAGPEGQNAGGIAAALDIAPSRLSFHLKALGEAGLVSSARQGKRIVYRAGYTRLQGLLAYLLEDCCGGAEQLERCCVTAKLP